jgi:hypothetical protein
VHKNYFSVQCTIESTSDHLKLKTSAEIAELLSDSRAGINSLRNPLRLTVSAQKQCFYVEFVLELTQRCNHVAHEQKKPSDSLLRRLLKHCLPYSISILVLPVSSNMIAVSNDTSNEKPDAAANDAFETVTAAAPAAMSEKPPSKRKDVIDAASALLALAPASPEEQAETTDPVPLKISALEKKPKAPKKLLDEGQNLANVSDDSDNHSLAFFMSSSPESSIITGSVSLAIESDADFLSPLHAFIRKYCVEAFSATQEDQAQSQFAHSHGSRIVQGQVGIRCLHCKGRAVKKERAVCFPSSMKNIYHCIETWQRRHSLVCLDIPAWVKKEMSELKERSKSGAGGRRQYWEESARRIGLANTRHGIRFVRTPGDLGEDVVEEVTTETANNMFAEDNVEDNLKARSVPVVRIEDREIVKDFLYILLKQMEECIFLEEDRQGGRSKVKDCPVGYPGMQCKHCGGKAGFGRYFPATLSALTSANSDRNIYNHIIKCRRCPQTVKDQLSILQQDQLNLKNRRGSRKLFFQKVWNRLHANSKYVVPRPSGKVCLPEFKSTDEDDMFAPVMPDLQTMVVPGMNMLPQPMPMMHGLPQHVQFMHMPHPMPHPMPMHFNMQGVAPMMQGDMQPMMQRPNSPPRMMQTNEGSILQLDLDYSPHMM